MAPKTFRTKADVDKLPAPEAGRVEYRHETRGGLICRVTAKGKKTFYLLYRVRGAGRAMKRARLGDYPDDVTFADVIAKCDVHKGKANAGEDLAEHKRALKAASTWAELSKQYLELHAKARKRSWATDERALKILGRHWDNWKLPDISRKEIRHYLDLVAKEGTARKPGQPKKGAPIHANRLLALMRKVFNWAIGRDLMDANPCAGIEPPGVERSRDRVLTNEEIRLFWSGTGALKFTWGEAAAAALRLELLTGQRGGEVLSMAWADVDLEAGWWTIPKERSKNKRAHRVPLSAPALEILTGRKTKAETDWVFPGKGTEKPAGNIASSLEKLRGATGLDFRPHDLRRTCATKLAEIGIVPYVISQVLNHASAEGRGAGAAVTMQHYALYAYDKEKRDALERWSGRLTEILAETPTAQTSAAPMKTKKAASSSSRADKSTASKAGSSPGRSSRAKGGSAK